MEDEEPAEALMDYLNQPLFKTVSTTAEMHRMELPLLILERQVGKAEGAESEPSPAELLVATLSLLPLSLLGKAGSGAEHSAVPWGRSSSPPSLWDCSSLAEPGPGRGMSIQLWKQKQCGKVLIKLNVQEILSQCFSKTEPKPHLWE